MDAEELKLALGERAKDIIAYGLNFKPNREKKVLCPLHTEKTPSMSWFSDGLVWRCHACAGTIDIYKYYTDYEHMSFVEAKERVAEITGHKTFEKSNIVIKKDYVLPNIIMRDLSKEAIEYMGKRKITEQTLDHWKVKQHKWNNKEVYVFQYFIDEKLTYITYREICKNGLKGGCELNTKPILWGMDNIDKSKPVVITEGQPDAMAVWQSGYKNVVSVPSGSNNFTWVDTCWEWLKDINEFIVFADNDDPGIKFANEVRVRLKNVKIIVSDKRKDANEVLYYDGPEKVLEIINGAINEMPNGLLDVSYLKYRSYLETVQDGIETGFIEYDSHVEDWKPEELTIIFGRNGEGKTTFVSQIIAHCLERGVKTFLYSGEMSDNKIQDWLYRQLVGNKKEYIRTIQTKYNLKSEVKPDIIKLIKQWHRGVFYLYDRKAEYVSKTLDSFFNLMELAAKRYSVKLFVIDNLMSKLEENADSLYSDQANFVQRCKDFTINNKCHVVLLAHPNKAKDEINNGESNLAKTDISGSNNIPNKADNIIAVERNWREDRDFDAIISSLKDRESGQRKVIKFNFSNNTLRFYNNRTNESVKYGWEQQLEKNINGEVFIKVIDDDDIESIFAN